MKTAASMIALVVTVALVTLSSSFVPIRADDQAENPSVVASEYRTMFRHEVDELGGLEEGKLPRVNSTESLQAGLNKLSSDGWELVAVEGGRRVSLTGPGNPTANYPPVYIFRRTGGR